MKIEADSANDENAILPLKKLFSPIFVLVVVKAMIYQHSRISKWFHYSTYQQFLDTFPFYLPYGKGSYVKRISKPKKLYYDIISRLGKYSYIFSPNLAGVYKRIINHKG